MMNQALDDQAKRSDQAQLSELSPEQTRLLSHVTAIDQEIGGVPGEDQGGAQVEEKGNAQEENIAILTALIEVLKPAAPFLKDCYPPQTIQQIAIAYTAVEEKHGWNARKFLSVEAQLAIVAIPPAIQAFILGREYFRTIAIQKKLPWWLKWWKKKPAEPVEVIEAEDGKM